MKKVFLFVFVSILFVGCSATLNSTVTSGYQPPQNGEIALSQIEHPSLTISQDATEALVDELKNCGYSKIVNPTKVDSILKANKIIIPRRIDEEFIRSMKNIIPSKYIMFGTIGGYQESGGFFNGAFGNKKDTKASIYLTLYELESGKVVWIADGDDTSGGEGGLFSLLNESPKSLLGRTIHNLFKKWDGFCK